MKTRESVMTALQARLATAVFATLVNGATTWKTISRKLVLFSDCPLTQRPALYITDHKENWSYQSENTPERRTIDVDLFIYTNAKSVAAPAADLNTILDAIDAALAPNFTGKQTLGGVVSHCRIDGAVLKDPGDIDGDGFLWVPLKILGP